MIVKDSSNQSTDSFGLFKNLGEICFNAFDNYIIEKKEDNLVP